MSFLSVTVFNGAPSLRFSYDYLRYFDEIQVANCSRASHLEKQEYQGKIEIEARSSRGKVGCWGIGRLLVVSMWTEKVIILWALKMSFCHMASDNPITSTRYFPYVCVQLKSLQRDWILRSLRINTNILVCLMPAHHISLISNSVHINLMPQHSQSCFIL